MSDRYAIHSRCADGPGLAPLLVFGIVAGVACAACAAALGAGWPLVLLTYWLAGTAGLLGAAALASGGVRFRSPLRLRLPRPAAVSLYALATTHRFGR